jgi:titin
VAIRDHNVTSALDSELLAGTTYYYRIFATNVVRESDPSGVVSATTSVDPASPTTVTASSSSPTQVDLTWTDVADETGYRVERSYDGVTGWMTVGTTGKDVTTFSDTGLPPSTTVYYRVFATNAGGDSAPSDVVRVTTTFETPSDVPAESSP